MDNFTYEVLPAPYESLSEIIKRTDTNGVVSYIPSDPANSDYQAYLKSLETDN